MQKNGASKQSSWCLVRRLRENPIHGNRIRSDLVVEQADNMSPRENMKGDMVITHLKLFLSFSHAHAFVLHCQF